MYFFLCVHLANALHSNVTFKKIPALKIYHAAAIHETVANFHEFFSPLHDCPDDRCRHWLQLWRCERFRGSRKKSSTCLGCSVPVRPTAACFSFYCSHSPGSHCPEPKKPQNRTKKSSKLSEAKDISHIPQRTDECLRGH